jgi:hypothetical protein
MSGELTLKKTLTPIPSPILGEGRKISVFFLLPLSLVGEGVGGVRG